VRFPGYWPAVLLVLSLAAGQTPKTTPTSAHVYLGRKVS